MNIINPSGQSSLAPLPASRALVPLKRAEANISSATALVTVRATAGTTGFLAQQIAQERLDDGLYLPRWRERAGAYRATAESRSGSVVVAA
jgi:hypothetical protein